MDISSSLVSQDGTLGKPTDAGKGQAGVVKRWLLEINLADKLEKDWRKSANDARDICRGKKKTQNGFNILWANTEVIRPNLYNSTPKPDVRRRYRDEDPVGKQIAEVIERGLSFEADCCDFDGVMESTVYDSVLPGRGAVRICFEPYYSGEGEDKTLAGAKVYPERVAWDSFRRGPGAYWEDVPWISYEHHLTMSEVGKKFPGFESKVAYDVVLKGAAEEAANLEPTVFKRVKVFEVWDKETRKIIWVAPSYAEAPLLTEDDKYGLKDFFDMPKPLYAIDDSTTLEPVCEYTLYEEQAKELNRVTKRINKLTEALKIRGVYDATLSELQTLMQSDDNDMIPTRDSTIALQAGGFDKAIWIMPIEQIAKVLGQLYIQREQVKMVIYEVVGISDILRGSTDPNETLGAQELKAQTGSVRLQRRQREVQRFVRDIFRIMAEIMCEHYPPELLTIMTGVQVTPEMMQIMQRDLLRGIHVDIETDSTIAADAARTRKDVAEIMEAVGGFVTAFGPAVQAGAISMEAAKKILGSIVRKARLGREVEDAIEQDAQQPTQPKPDPEMAKMQMEQQAKQADLQMQQQQLQADAQKDQAEMALKQQEMEQQAQLDRERLVIETQLKREEMAANIALKREDMTLGHEVAKEGQKLKADAASKPTTKVSLGSDDAVAALSESLKGGMQDGNSAIMQALEQNAQMMFKGFEMLGQSMVEGDRLLAEAIKAPKTLSKDGAGNWRTDTATLQ